MKITYTAGHHKKPSLTVTPYSTLSAIKKEFEEKYSFKQINTIITSHFSSLKTSVKVPNSTGIYTDGCQHGTDLFLSTVKRLEEDMELINLSSLYYFIFWMCDWWNYSLLARDLNYLSDHFIEHKKSSRILIKEYITPILPEEIQEQVKSMQVTSAVCNPHHFAILFNNSEAMQSCILTNTKIIALDDVDGKDAYIADIAPTGKLNIANFLDKKGTHIYIKDN